MSIKSLAKGSRGISLLANNTPEHHVLIAEQTVDAGGSASVTFSNIDQSYQYLQIRGILRDTQAAGTFNNAYIRFNGDSGSNYACHILYGNGTSALSAASTSVIAINSGVYTASTSASSGVFSAFIVDILDYTNTSKYKTTRSLTGGDNNGSGIILLVSGLWMNTNAITSINLPASGSYVQYSTVQLYGVK